MPGSIGNNGLTSLEAVKRMPTKVLTVKPVAPASSLLLGDLVRLPHQALTDIDRTEDASLLLSQPHRPIQGFVRLKTIVPMVYV